MSWCPYTLVVVVVMMLLAWWFIFVVMAAIEVLAVVRPCQYSGSAPPFAFSFPGPGPGEPECDDVPGDVHHDGLHTGLPATSGLH